MNRPKVSIIVPIYNVAAYLQRCMDSLLNQTLRDIEIILVDDGSPDNCPQMCDEYAKQDNRIKVIHKKNEGLGYARNTGLEATCGEFIAFIDSDDYVDLAMYETLYNKAIENQSDVVFCGMQRRCKDGMIFPRRDVEQETIFQGDDVLMLAKEVVACAPGTPKERHFMMSVWHSIYKASIIKEKNLHFVSERVYTSEDLPFQVDFFKSAQKVIYIPNIFYNYCENKTSLTATFNINKIYRTIKLYNLLNKKLAEIDPQKLHTRRFLLSILRTMSVSVVEQNLGIKTKIKFLQDICKCIKWDEYADYPIEKAPLFARISFYLMKYNCVYFLYLYNILYSTCKAKSERSAKRMLNK